MIAVLNFIDYIGDAILGLLILAIFANAILSWLVAFDVVNLRNRFVYQLSRMLEAVCQPILRPFQKIVPPLGGVDITPLIALIILQGIRAYLWPALINFLLHLLAA
ncbi:MAG TPA: YggT family protein [Caulobacteraceae bacterium]|nr:YggT family protein [Caulobacteraceae bacterium]